MRTLAFISGTVGAIEAGKQDPDKVRLASAMASSGLVWRRAEPLREHPDCQGEAFLLSALSAQLRSFQQQQANFHHRPHVQLKMQLGGCGLLLPWTDDKRTTGCFPQGVSEENLLPSYTRPLSASLDLLSWLRPGFWLVTARIMR